MEQKNAVSQAATSDEEARFELDEYESDQDQSPNTKPTSSVPGISGETLALMKKLGMPVGDKEDDADDTISELKIYYCSRTHSQLTQFSSELRRVRLPPVLPPLDGTSETSLQAGTESLVEDLKHVTLGSRKNLCINPKVNRLSSATAINEKCLELQQPGTSADHRCSYLPNSENKGLVHDFRDNALAKIRDIEDLGYLGKRLGICPYYASRSTVGFSEVHNISFIYFYLLTLRRL